MELDNLAIAIISYTAGIVTGFFLHRLLSKKPFNFGSDSKISYLILIVSLVWLISVLVDITSSVYETSPFIHGIMGAIVGFFFYTPKGKK